MIPLPTITAWGIDRSNQTIPANARIEDVCKGGHINYSGMESDESVVHNTYAGLPEESLNFDRRLFEAVESIHKIIKPILEKIQSSIDKTAFSEGIENGFIGNSVIGRASKLIVDSSSTLLHSKIGFHCHAYITNFSNVDNFEIKNHAFVYVSRCNLTGSTALSFLYNISIGLIINVPPGRTKEDMEPEAIRRGMEINKDMTERYLRFQLSSFNMIKTCPEYRVLNSDSFSNEEYESIIKNIKSSPTFFEDLAIFREMLALDLDDLQVSLNCKT